LFSPPQNVWAFSFSVWLLSLLSPTIGLQLPHHHILTSRQNRVLKRTSHPQHTPHSIQVWTSIYVSIYSSFFPFLGGQVFVTFYARCWTLPLPIRDFMFFIEIFVGLLRYSAPSCCRCLCCVTLNKYRYSFISHLFLFAYHLDSFAYPLFF
jgi:hypothetical protein